MSHEPDAWLDAMLTTADPAIADDGFTARVLTALPPPRPERQRSTVLVAATLLSSVLGLWVLPSGVALQHLVNELAQAALLRGGATLPTLLVGACLLVGAAATFVAVSDV